MTVDPLDTVSDTATEDPLLAHVTLAGFYPPPMGGESLHVKQLAELLRECGVEVDVVNLDRSARPSREYRSAGSRLGRMRMLLGAAGSSSVFHLHAIGHNRLSWGVIAAVALSVWVRRRAALLTIHSGVFPSYVATFGPIRSWLAGRVLRAFRRILCVNGDIAATVRALGIDPQKALVVSPFLGIRKVPCLTTADEEIATRYHPLLVAVGGGDRDPGQGLPTIVQACRGLLRRFPGAGVVFLGGRVNRALAPLMGEADVRDHVVCLGEVSHERCLALLAASDVLVRSTFADGDSIAVREGLALGVPVVASDTAYRPVGVRTFKKGDAGDLEERLTATLLGGRSRRSAWCSAESAEGTMWRVYRDVARERGRRVRLAAWLGMPRVVSRLAR
jgi:glycosyltransferase involved in cell wall biosynthesis